MITLKEALTLSKEELNKFKEDLQAKIAAQSELNAYIDVNNEGDGVPIAIKDNIQVKGWSVTSASNILQGYIAPYNATVIEKLKEAGLCAFGRTNMDEFAMGSTTESSFYGKTLNPVNAAHVPGGSSGGSAAAVGAGLAIAALGSDTGGSIRQPAAYCGIVGMKPTYGRVSRYGVGAYASSLDQIGPMTQNVEDAAILYDIIAGSDERDSTNAGMDDKVTPNLNANRKLTIAVLPKYLENASADIQEAYSKAIEAMEAYDNMFSEVAEYGDPARAMMNEYKVEEGLENEDVAESIKSLAESYNMRITGDIKMYTKDDAVGDEVKHARIISLCSLHIAKIFLNHSRYYGGFMPCRIMLIEYGNGDKFLVTMDMTLAIHGGFPLPKEMEMYLSDIYTISINLAGLPALSLPIMKNADGLPVGLQLIAKAYDEQTLFDGALSLEKKIAYKA